MLKSSVAAGAGPNVESPWCQNASQHVTLMSYVLYITLSAAICAMGCRVLAALKRLGSVAREFSNSMAMASGLLGRFDCCIGAVRAWGSGFAKEKTLCHARKRCDIIGEKFEVRDQLLIGWRSCSVCHVFFVLLGWFSCGAAFWRTSAMYVDWTSPTQNHLLIASAALDANATDN